MSLFLRLLNKLPRKEMWLDDQPYLTRWYLFKLWGRTYVLHRFEGPDPDRRMHTHPWDLAWALILWGSYVEERTVAIDTMTGPVTKTHRVRWLNVIKGTDSHRVVELSRKHVWTLFSMGNRMAHWGFLGSTPRICGHGLLRRMRYVWEYIPYEDSPSEGQFVKTYGTCKLWEGAPL